MLFCKYHSEIPEHQLQVMAGKKSHFQPISHEFLKTVRNRKFCVHYSYFQLIPYDTIRDAILTRAQKLTQVSLTYRTEPETKKWEKEKLKSKKRSICSEVSVNSPGNPWTFDINIRPLWRVGSS